MEKIQEFQMNETKYDELESFINELYNNTSDSVYQDGKEIVESDKKKKIRMLMEYPLKKEFLQNVSFEFKTDDDIIDDIKHNIRFQHNTPEINVHECMITLLGELRYSYKDSIQRVKHWNLMRNHLMKDLEVILIFIKEENLFQSIETLIYPKSL